MKDSDALREVYVKEFERYSQLQVQNLLNQDTVLVQLSVGLLAALATFGKDVLTSSHFLGYATVILLSLTIFQVLAGYFVSNIFFVHVKGKITDNYSTGKVVNADLDQHWSGKFNRLTNTTQFLTFLVAMLTFALLVIFYIGDNNVKSTQRTTAEAHSSQGEPWHHRYHSRP